MENKITIREAVLEQDIAAFWEQLHIYHGAQAGETNKINAPRP